MVVLTIQGKVDFKKDIDDGFHSIRQEEIRYRKEFTDPITFHKSIRKSGYAMVNKCLPPEYTAIDREEYTMRIDFNAVEAIEWAEEIAKYREEDTKLDILTYWLEVFGGMRIRRAIHSILKDEYDIDTNVEGIR